MSEFEISKLKADIEELEIVINVRELPSDGKHTFIRVIVDYLGEINPDTGENLTSEEAASLVYNYISESLLWEHPCRIEKVADSDGVGVILLRFK